MKLLKIWIIKDIVKYKQFIDSKFQKFIYHNFQ
jgi:hypothetical protein